MPFAEFNRPIEKYLVLVAASIIGLGVIVAAHFFEPHYLSRNAKYLIKTLHAPGFAAVACSLAWFLGYLGVTRPRRYIIAAGAAMAAGVISEIAQIAGPREADVGDLVRDAVGICAGIGIAALLDRPLRQSLDRTRLSLLIAFSLFAVSLSFSSTISSAHSLLSRNAAIPALLTFSSRWERYLYDEANDPTAKIMDPPADWRAVSTYPVLRVSAKGRYNTFLHLRPYPDWTAFSGFNFVAASADNSEHDIRVTIRDIRPGPDSPRNSYHGEIRVTPTPTRFSFSFLDIDAGTPDRPFDFSHVDIIVIRQLGDDVPATLQLGDFRLQ